MPLLFISAIITSALKQSLDFKASKEGRKLGFYGLRLGGGQVDVAALSTYKPRRDVVSK